LVYKLHVRFQKNSTFDRVTQRLIEWKKKKTIEKKFICWYSKWNLYCGI